MGWGIAALLLLGAAPLSAQDAATGAPITQAERERLDATGAIGQLIFDYDRAAWVATDAMSAAIARADLPKTGGWVVLPRADGALVVTFYEGAEGQGRGYFIAAVKDGRVIEQKVIASSDRLPLAADQQRMADALRVASERSGHQPCAPAKFNAVVLPPATLDAPVTVYLLTPQVQQRAYPFGGHFRVDVGSDNRIVLDRGFTKACLTMAPPAEHTVGMTVSHLLDPWPTEIHVFLSILTRMPIGVATTDGRFWIVAGRRIGLLRENADGRTAP